ncbi:MAG: hypothetical protein WC426_11010 [Sulfuriferula sp.]
MNRFLPFYGMMLLLLSGLPAHAELRIDNTQKSASVYSKLNSVTASRQRFDSDKFIYSTSEGAYLRDPSNAKRKYTWFGIDTPVEGSNFSWVFDGKSYLSSINSYNLEEPLPARCNVNLNPNANCNPHENGVVCHLFLYDSETVDTVAIVRLDIKRDSNEIKGMPSCDGVNAMAIAKEVPDSMLISLEYTDSLSLDSTPLKHSTTVLLRLTNQNGKLNIKQDDSCLGNPNKLKTISAARNALKQCATQNAKTINP